MENEKFRYFHRIDFSVYWFNLQLIVLVLSFVWSIPFVDFGVSLLLQWTENKFKMRSPEHENERKKELVISKKLKCNLQGEKESSQ